ncbi:MAG: alanine--tRNA ligase [Candidatus Marinimicrobia bacterium]|nr:alanine--tRNA ligase [Candidatus Neomarinimicrobiota bacterium]
MKTAKQIRQEFIDFFKTNDHKIVPSSPVIPQDDPTLLFINAGMNQFKPIFLNQEEADHPRVADTQKCIRVSGKHNDLEEVGRDTYHHTFFEMLGNWSFGDYYKKEAIEYAWKLFTEVWGLEKDRLWATVYHDDDEAANLWKEVTDINPDRILKFDEKDNFWEMGDTGPCGPCSEIHYYKGEDISGQSAELVNAGNPDLIELWNLVFIQYNRDKDGKLNTLPRKHVDTGAGLERIVAVMQNKYSNYDTDLFQPIIQKIAEISGVEYTEKDGTPHRVIADHIKMMSFSIADGGLPSNEGRGYVIRRLLRRAARFGKMLNMHQPFMYQLIDSVIEIYGEVFPEIKERKAHVEKVIKAEEESFGETLERGLNVFEKICDKDETKSSKIISGADAFLLYDTYGFPLDLTVLISEEKGLKVDTVNFEKEMEKQKELARASRSFTADLSDISNKWIVVSEGNDSQFLGYTDHECLARVRKYFIFDETINIIFDQTVFYAESGGEIGDTGTITGEGFKISVTDTQKSGDSHVHIGNLIEGEFNPGVEMTLTVDDAKSDKIRANHTATHLMHKALKQVVGEHVNQAGSLVNEEHLRFDFTHYEKVTPAELEQVEKIVNAVIRKNLRLTKSYMPMSAAKEMGATALFGEKYGETVRVVQVEGFSMELCGGKHVTATGDIGLFRILSESSVASGVRRIEAVTGEKAYQITRENEKLLREIEHMLSASKETVVARVQSLQGEIKSLQKQIQELQQKTWKYELDDLIEKAEKIGDIKALTHRIEGVDMNQLKEIGDIVRSKLGEGVGAIASVVNDKPLLAVMVTDDTIKKYNLKAGDIVREMGNVLGGGGGGRPHMATAGGKDVSKLDQAFEKFYEIIKEKVR